jgi:hypothetical protein
MSRLAKPIPAIPKCCSKQAGAQPTSPDESSRRSADAQPERKVRGDSSVSLPRPDDSRRGEPRARHHPQRSLAASRRHDPPPQLGRAEYIRRVVASLRSTLHPSTRCDMRAAGLCHGRDDVQETFGHAGGLTGRLAWRGFNGRPVPNTDSARFVKSSVKNSPAERNAKLYRLVH